MYHVFINVPQKTIHGRKLCGMRADSLFSCFILSPFLPVGPAGRGAFVIFSHGFAVHGSVIFRY
jgi:hypothetical protein